jgi:hypothetical protein
VCIADRYVGFTNEPDELGIELRFKGGAELADRASCPVGLGGSLALLNLTSESSREVKNAWSRAPLIRLRGILLKHV